MRWATEGAMIRTSIHPIGRRRGFTLIELLVAAAICVIIMTVLATAFQIGIDTMRQMRSAGDMADQLRAANEVMRRDLSANMFIPEEGKPNGGTVLSNQRFDLGDASPIGGFFLLSSPDPTSEGVDSDSFASTRTTNHVLQFTSITPQTSAHGEQTLFTATSPPAPTVVGGQTINPTTYSSPAAEIVYFLAPIPTNPPTSPPLATFTDATNTMQLFNLIRRQRLVATNDDAVFALKTPVTLLPTDQSDSDVISVSPSTGLVNTMRSLAVKANRLNPSAINPISTAGRIGEDVLLSNVISFEVKLSWSSLPANTGTFPNPRPFLSPNTDFPFDSLGSFSALSNSTFDTAPAAPQTFSAIDKLQIRARAIQIRLRVFDPKLQTARQSTIIQSF